MSTREPPAFVYRPLPAKLPEGFGAAPALPGEQGALRACAVFDRGSKALVLLRVSVHARVYLGALIDGAGRVHRWLELQEQDPMGAGLRAQAAGEVLNNAIIDERWAAHASRLAGVAPAGLVALADPRARVAPMVLDLAKGTVASATDSAGAPFAVWTDDGALRQRDLSPFSSTVDRYLKAGEDAIALNTGAPRDARTHEAADALGLGAGRIGWCLAGGLIITGFAPLSFERYVDALTALTASAEQKASPSGGKSRGPLEGALQAGAQGEGSVPGLGGQALLSRRGASGAGAAVEIFHHKVALLLDVAEQVRAAVAQRNEPLLNLSARGVRVALGGSSTLPAPWTARAVLVEPGAGAVLPVRGTRERLFLNLSSEGASVYQAAGAGTGGAGASATGTLRVRRVVSQGGAATLEGTLTTHERVRASRSDCLWMRLAIDTGRCDLLCRVDPKSALASGEVRLTSLPHELDEATVGALKTLEGQQLHDVAFELAPMVTSAADVYALGVLGIRALLTTTGTTLNTAWDDVQSLASEVRARLGEAPAPAATGADGPIDLLAGVIAQVLAGDDRFGEALGPHRATGAEWSKGENPGAVPMALWCRALAWLVRCFPGSVAQAYARDIGDAPGEAVHVVLDGPVDDLARLVGAARGMLIGDAAADAELAGIVRALTGS